MTGCPDSMTSAAPAARGARADGAGRAGAASTARRSAGGTHRSPEPDSGAGRAFHLHSFLEIAAQPSAVPPARLHTRKVLHGWGLAAVADTAELLVSELVTNAIRASASTGLAALWLLLIPAGEGVRIQVWDGCPDRPALPARQHGQPADAEGGRGLLLTEALSDSSGVYRAAGGGKVVWCVLTDPAARGPHRGHACPAARARRPRRPASAAGSPPGRS
jgi:anti-sigma regulatory factor (Ser/Thr protein kinase)